MSDLQHQRIVELCQELRLSAMPNVYSGAALSSVLRFCLIMGFENSPVGIPANHSAGARPG
jgi:hypothetical protein